MLIKDSYFYSSFFSAVIEKKKWRRLLETINQKKFWNIICNENEECGLGYLYHQRQKSLLTFRSKKNQMSEPPREVGELGIIQIWTGKSVALDTLGWTKYILIWKFCSISKLLRLYKVGNTIIGDHATKLLGLSFNWSTDWFALSCAGNAYVRNEI